MTERRASPAEWRTILGRVFTQLDNPSAWTIPLIRLAGVRWRIHMITLAAAGLAMASTLLPNQLGAVYMGLFLFGMGVALLVHECGHVVAARLTGGSAPRIAFLPWGGLRLWTPGGRRGGEMLIAAGGPMAGVACLAFTSLALLSLEQLPPLAHHSLIGHNPLSLIDGLRVSTPDHPWLPYLVAAVRLAHVAAAWVLVINLLPAFPFDAGVFVQSALRRRLGWGNATAWSARIGLAVSAGLVVLAASAFWTLRAPDLHEADMTALSMRGTVLTLLGVIALASCLRQLAAPRAIDDLADPVDVPPMSAHASGHAAPAEPPVIASDTARDPEADRRELDALLERISRDGLPALSDAEHERLEALRRRLTEG